MGFIEKEYVIDTPLEPEQVYTAITDALAKPPVFIRLRKTEKQFIGEIDKETLRLNCYKKGTWVNVVGDYSNGKYLISVDTTLAALIFFILHSVSGLMFLALIIFDNTKPKLTIIYVFAFLLIVAGLIKNVYDFRKERAITIDELAHLLKAEIKEV